MRLNQVYCYCCSAAWVSQRADGASGHGMVGAVGKL